MRFLNGLLFLLAICVFVGCQGKVLVSDRSQAEAVQIRAFLTEHGVPTEIQEDSGKEGRYSILVSDRSFPVADVLLKRLDSQLGILEESALKTTLEGSSFLPPSRMTERVRLDHILALELERVLETDSRIALARAVVRSHFIGESSSAGKPGVALLVQVAPNATVSSDELAELIKTVVPGVRKEDIAVRLTPTPEGYRKIVSVGGEFDPNANEVIVTPLISFLTPSLGWQIPQGQQGLAMFIMFFFGASCFCLGLAGGYFYNYFRRAKDIAEIEQMSHRSEGQTILPSESIGKFR